MILTRHSSAFAADPKRRGSVLAISLIVVMVIASLGAGLIQMHGAIARRQLQSIDNKRALYIAEAGLSEAFMAIAHGKSGQIGSEVQPAVFGNGLFWVEAAEQPDRTVALVSNGLCETGRFSLAMTVQREISPIASLGMFGSESVRIGEGVVLDGYDSQKGSFASQVNARLPNQTTGKGARITSNAEVRIAAAGIQVGGLIGINLGAGLGALNPSTWVYGDVVPGPDAGVLAEPGVLVTGDTMPALRPVGVEYLEAPTDLNGATALNHLDGTQMVLNSVQNQYRKIHVGSGSELILQGPVTLLAGGMTMEPGSTLTVDTTGGPVMIYLTSYLNMEQGSTVANLSEDPTQMALVVGATEDQIDVDGDGIDEPAVNIAATGDFYGMMYAPTADLDLPASLRMYGCVSGKSVDLEDGAHFSFDRAMVTTGVAVTGLPGLLSWRIVELPNAAIVRRRVDPMRALQVAGVTPTPSHQAYAESFIRLNYLDAGGTPQQFEGLESTLNWALVSTVETMQWAGGLAGLNLAPKSNGNGRSTPATNY